MHNTLQELFIAGGLLVSGALALLGQITTGDELAPYATLGSAGLLAVVVIFLVTKFLPSIMRAHRSQVEALAAAAAAERQQLMEAHTNTIDRILASTREDASERRKMFRDTLSDLRSDATLRHSELQTALKENTAALLACRLPPHPGKET